METTFESWTDGAGGQLMTLRTQQRERSLYSDWTKAERPRGRSSSHGRFKNLHFFISRPVLGSAQPPMQRSPVVGPAQPPMQRSPVVGPAQPPMQRTPVVGPAQPPMQRTPVVGPAQPPMQRTPVVGPAQPSMQRTPVLFPDSKATGA
jgi:hypothetical protein